MGFEIIIFALATWRAASLLVNEKGPFDVFSRLRTWAGIEELRLDDKPEVYKAVPDTFLAQVLDCVWCCSVWVALGWTVVYWGLPTLAGWLALPLALSTFAIMVQKWIDRQ